LGIVKKSLTCSDIAEGKRYKVIKKPDHLRGIDYPWLNMVGVCKWIVGNDVCMVFGECKERAVPPSCLELEESPIQMNEKPSLDDHSTNDNLILFYANQANEQAKEREREIEQAKEREREYANSTPKNIKLDNLYRIARIPPFWITTGVAYPSLGQIGRCIKIGPKSVTLKMNGGGQRFVPFTCLEAINVIIPPAPVINLSDDKLIDSILANPLGCLRIVKGLTKMNKDPRLIAFVQRGILI
jgi:hypothetical protein